MDDSTKTLADYPQLLAEWNPEQESSDDITPDTVLARWKRDARWICSRDSSHRWKAGIRARVRWLEDGSKPGGKGACPWCWQAPSSDVEQWLAAQLRKRFVFDVDAHKVDRLEHVYDVDILIPSQGGRSVIIEFDGAHYHRCTTPDCTHDGETSCRHNGDLKKSRVLETMPDRKYRVIRVRERPLDAGQEHWHRHRHWVYVPRQQNSEAREMMLRRVLAKLNSLGGFRPVRVAARGESADGCTNV